jgi:hypothetical protein
MALETLTFIIYDNTGKVIRRVVTSDFEINDSWRSNLTSSFSYDDSKGQVKVKMGYFVLIPEIAEAYFVREATDGKITLTNIFNAQVYGNWYSPTITETNIINSVISKWNDQRTQPWSTKGPITIQAGTALANPLRNITMHDGTGNSPAQDVTYLSKVMDSPTNTTTPLTSANVCLRAGAVPGGIQLTVGALPKASTTIAYREENDYGRGIYNPVINDRHISYNAVRLYNTDANTYTTNYFLMPNGSVVTSYDASIGPVYQRSELYSTSDTTSQSLLQIAASHLPANQTSGFEFDVYLGDNLFTLDDFRVNIWIVLNYYDKDNVLRTVSGSVVENNITPSWVHVTCGLEKPRLKVTLD